MTVNTLSKPRRFSCRTVTTFCNNRCDECNIQVEEQTTQELAAKVGFNFVDWHMEHHRWKIDVKKPELTGRTWWSSRYADSPHEALRVIAGYTKRGTPTRLSGKIYHHPKYDDPYYYYGPKINAENLEEWLLAEESRYGYPREYWKQVIHQVKIDVGDLPPEEGMVARWMTVNGPFKTRSHEYFDDARSAIRRYMRLIKGEYIEPTLRVQVVAATNSPYLPEDGDGISWLLSREETLGKSQEYWRELIADVETDLAHDSRELQLEPPIRVDNELAFRLSDVPRDFEIRLSDELVLALDKANRPFKYKAGWGKTNRIWAAKENLTKRLWDEYSRFRRRGKIYDRGAFITMDQADEIVAKTTLTWEQLEQHVTGIRMGTSSAGNQITVSFPLRPDKWWAKIIGFWFSSGGYNFRERERDGMKHTEAVLRFSFDSTVVPLFMEAMKEIGSIPYRRFDKSSQAIKAMDMRARPKSTMIVNRTVIPILEKFGMHLPTREQRPKATQGGGRKKAAKLYNVHLPPWILENDEYMHSFVEGYINGQGCASMMNSNGPAISTQVYILFSSIVPEEGKIMGEQVQEYLARAHDLHIKGDQMQRKSPRSQTWRLSVRHREDLSKLLDGFEIARVGARARLLLTEAIQQYRLLWEVVKQLNAQQIVLLGMLYEAPRGYQEIKEAVPLRPEVLDDSLKAMKELNVIKEENGVWAIDYTSMKMSIMAEKAKTVEVLQQTAAAYAERLLFQCTNCSQVYIKHREICGICEEAVEPIERRHVLRPINIRLGRLKLSMKKMEKSEPLIAKAGDKQ